MPRFEQIWLLGFSLIILIMTVVFSLQGTIWTDPFSIILNWVIAPVSALSGVICVVLVARGSIHNYSFGLVNSFSYGLIAWLSGYYGDWILNWFFFVPTQFLILLFWRGKIRKDSKDIVRMKKLSLLQIIGLVIIGVVASIIFGIILLQVDFWFVNIMKRNESIYLILQLMFGLALIGPIFDAASEVLQISAQILCIKRYAEQWPLWMATNVLSIIMWISVIVIEPSSLPWAVPTLVMWIAYLVNSFYGTRVWFRDAKRVLD